MSRLPNLNGTGLKSIGAPLHHSGNLLLESGGLSRATVIAPSYKPSALPSLYEPRAPPLADVRPKRRSNRKVQPQAPVPTRNLAGPAGFSSGIRQVPAPPNKKEVSFIQLLKNHKLLPNSRPSSPGCPTRHCNTPLYLEEPNLNESRFRAEVAQPVALARGVNFRPKPLVQKEPLLARRAKRDAPKVIPAPPKDKPTLLPALSQGNTSLISSNAWDQSTKKLKKGSKGSRVHWDSTWMPV